MKHSAAIRIKGIVALVILVMPVLLNAQEIKKEEFGIRFTGFVKSDFFYDSRQTVNAREGHFMLWPAPCSLNDAGEDINALGQFNFLSIQTRLRGNISGPEAFGAQTSGAIEGSFFGTSNADVNGFRLRHAYVKLNWEKAELLAGQYWHPMFVTGSFPGTLSFNTGVPFQPFSRNPQLRFTYGKGNLKLMAALLAQRDFTSAGGSEVLRNSRTPDLQVQIRYEIKDADKEMLAGAGAGFKRIVPRTLTDSGDVTRSDVKSLSFQAFVKYRIPALTFKAQAVCGQNMYDMMQISSYAVMDLDPAINEADPDRDYRIYTPLGNYSLWAELHSNGKTIQVGVFAGYTRSTGTRFMGASEILVYQPDGNYVYAGSRSNIDYIWRVSPRLIWNAGKVRIAGELEFTKAAFGTFTGDGTVADARPVTNFRALLGVYYFF